MSAAQLIRGFIVKKIEKCTKPGCSGVCVKAGWVTQVGMLVQNYQCKLCGKKHLNKEEIKLL